VARHLGSVAIAFSNPVRRDQLLYGIGSMVVADNGSGVPQPRSPAPGSQGRPSATAIALQQTRALVVPGVQFARFMTTEPDAMAAIARDLESRLSETSSA
jgi:CRP-like cAMP-binding protein